LLSPTPRKAMSADQKIQYDSDPGLKEDDDQPGQCGRWPPLTYNNKKSYNTNNPFGNI